MSIDLYLPSMPAMARDWQVGTTLIQNTMSSFLIGYSLSQLFYGPLSDRFGRRPIIVSGITLYLLASIVSALAPSAQFLIDARLFQGLGAGAASVLSRAIMRDVYSGRELAKVSAYAGIAWSIVPLLAPVLGGYIQHYISWRGNFWVLVGLGFFALFYSLFIFQETQDKTHRHPLKVKTILRNFSVLVVNPIFNGNVMVLIALYGAMVAFNIAAPFILQNELGLNAVQYGWIIIIITSGYLFGSIIAGWAASRFTYSQTIYAGMVLYFLSTISFFIIAMMNILNLWVIILPMFFLMVSSSIVYPTATAGSLLPFPRLAGIAGALYGFIVIAGGSLVSMLIAELHEVNQQPLAWILLLLGVFAVVGYFFLVTLKKASMDESSIE